MKTSENSLVILTVTFFFASLSLSGCDFSAAEDALSNFDVIISLEEVNSYVALTVVDGQTGNFVQQQVNLAFFGQDSDAVIDMFSDPVTDLSVSGGIGSFGIRNALVPSDSNPIEVRIQVEAQDYQPNSVTIALTKTGQTDARIYLFREIQGIPGSETGTNSGNIGSGGVVLEDIEARTLPNPMNQAQATVSVRAGTQGTTATGESASGELSVEIVYFTANSSSTAVVFPGGFRGTVETLDGTLEQVSFTTAGFMSVTATDSNGNEITQFNPPIELSMEVAPNTINGHTGSPVSTGDAIDFYSYSETGGYWVEEGESTLEGPGSNGNYTVKFLTSHLSTWSAGYNDGGCDSGVFSIQRNGNTAAITARAFSASGGWFGASVVIPSGESDLTILNAPSHLTDFEVVFEVNGQEQTIQRNTGICGATGAVAFDSPINVIDVHFALDLGDACEALKLNDVPAFAIFHKRQGEPDVSTTSVTTQPIFHVDELGRITGGEITIPGLELGLTYTFYTTINNERAERDILIEGSEMFFDLSEDVFEADICAN